MACFRDVREGSQLRFACLGPNLTSIEDPTFPITRNRAPDQQSLPVSRVYSTRDNGGYFPSERHRELPWRGSELDGISALPFSAEFTRSPVSAHFRCLRNSPALPS